MLFTHEVTVTATNFLRVARRRGLLESRLNEKFTKKKRIKINES